MRDRVMLVIISMLLVLPTASVDAQSAFPDPTKWDSAGVVRVFEENAGALLSGFYRRGGSDNGASSFSLFNDMLLRNPNSIQSLEATVTVLDASSAGSIITAPRAGLEGFFYWNGNGTGTSTDQTGHVTASTAIGLNTTSGALEARYFIVRCNDAPCNSSTTVVSVAIKPVGFFEAHRLRVSYDGGSFAFQVDGDPPIVFAAPDATRLAPTFRFKTLRTRAVINASPTAAASILALFENVAVNGAPYEDFNVKDLPRVQILPGSGTFSSHQSFDAVIIVETAGEAVSTVRLTANGSDISSALSSAVHGTLPSGGITYRVPNVPATALPAGTPVVLAAEATTVSGKTARGFAVWNTVTVSE